MTTVHTIEKNITPEHAEEIRQAQQSTEVGSWGVEEIEAYLTKHEEKIGLHARANTRASDLGWAFVLFPEDQARDEEGYPVNFDHEQVIGRKNIFINNCRILLKRIDNMGMNKHASKDVNDEEFTLEFRVRRLIEDRKDMFDQYNIWNRRFKRVNAPRQACDNTDKSLKEDESNSPYQKVLLYLLTEASRMDYRRYRDQCCTQIRNTRAWRQVKEIKDFVYDTTQKEDQPEMWKNLTSRGNMVADVVRHLSQCKDIQFPEIKKDRHTWSFENGLLVGKDWDPQLERYKIKFYPYCSREFRELDPTLVSCKYFDMPFDPYDHVADWYDIPTPHMQCVLDYQRFETDVCKWMYVFCGRLCFEVNELDGWQVIPFLKGIARSGKSTLITKVCKLFYECEDVATLSNNIEKKFGLQSIYRGFMFISPEIKGDLQLEQAEFQSLVSGEDVSVARKNESALSMQWKTPGILGGNEVPNWKDNSGSILRRLATWNFARQVSEADPHLDDKL